MQFGNNCSVTNGIPIDGYYWKLLKVTDHQLNIKCISIFPVKNLQTKLFKLLNCYFIQKFENYSKLKHHNVHFNVQINKIY